jgi:hypothetical protein
LVALLSPITATQTSQKDKEKKLSIISTLHHRRAHSVSQLKSVNLSAF